MNKDGQEHLKKAYRRLCEAEHLLNSQARSEFTVDEWNKILQGWLDLNESMGQILQVLDFKKWMQHRIRLND